MSHSVQWFLGTLALVSLSAVTAKAQSQTLFTTQTPAARNVSDGSNVNYELGMRFSADVSGQIKAIRFFKGRLEKGKHIGKIFSTSGQLLASVTFANESLSGWQKQALPTPLHIDANTEYVVSVNSVKSYYVDTVSGLASQIVNGHLRSSVGNNGLYGSVGQLPTRSWNDSNYFRDIVFAADSSGPAPSPTPAPTPAPSATPTPAPSATPVPPSSGSYPDASNTGVPAGVQLTPYNGTLSISTDGTVVEGLDIVGNVMVQAKNVTIRNCRITSNTPYHLIYVIDGQADGFRLEHSELIGNGTTTNGVLGYGTFIANHIHGFENGLNIWGGLAQDNYIHDMRGNADSHFDGIEINGANGLQIIHNTVINENDQTSAIMMDTYFSGIANITIDNNRLVGGGYTVYLDGRFSGGSVDSSGVSITNNRVGQGYWGYFALYDNTPYMSGNVDDSTGQPIP